jgi:hypothetical protein
LLWLKGVEVDYSAARSHGVLADVGGSRIMVATAEHRPTSSRGHVDGDIIAARKGGAISQKNGTRFAIAFEGVMMSRSFLSKTKFELTDSRVPSHGAAPRNHAEPQLRKGTQRPSGVFPSKGWAKTPLVRGIDEKKWVG